MKPRILVILGTTREGRRGEAVAKWAMSVLTLISEADFELVDLRDWDLPYYNFSGYPSTEKGKYFSEIQEKWGKKIDEADGFLMITSEYNRGYPAVLKNALDYLWYEWNHKPISFITYGGISGGLRAAEQLRQVIIELEMVPIRDEVVIHGISRSIDENGNMKKDEKSDEHLKSVAKRLVLWANSLKKIRIDLSY